MMDFLLMRNQMPDGVEVPDWRSQASKWEADGKLRVWIWASDDIDVDFEVAFDLALDLIAAVLVDCDDLVGLDLALAGRLMDEALDRAAIDDASAAALAALVTLRVDIPANWIL
jgi:hypothetical protein